MAGFAVNWTAVAIFAIGAYLWWNTSVDGSAEVDSPEGDSGPFDTIYSSTVGAFTAMDTTATVSQQGRNFTAGHELCSLTAYWDAGSYSIGYGHKPASQGQTCTQEQADTWLTDDLIAAADTVLSCVSVELTQTQLDVLADMAYNVGSTKFRGAHDLLAAVNSGDPSQVPHQLARWNHSGGVFSKPLDDRCQDRIALWNSEAA